MSTEAKKRLLRELERLSSRDFGPAIAAIEAKAVANERLRIDPLLLDEWVEPEDESMIGWNLAIKRARAIVGGDP